MLAFQISGYVHSIIELFVLLWWYTCQHMLICLHYKPFCIFSFFLIDIKVTADGVSILNNKIYMLYKLATEDVNVDADAGRPSTSTSDENVEVVQ